MANILPRNVDFTDKDFDSIRDRLFKLIRSVFPAWTDDRIVNFGNLLVELHAWVGDVLCFYQDNQARERFITTARLRRNLIALSKLVGYSPQGASAATADVTLTLAVAAAGVVTVAAGDKVQTAEITTPTAYQVLSEVVFTPGETTKQVSVENSERTVNSFASTGLANQAFVLTRTPFLDGSAVVTAGNGTFVEVGNFLESTAVDKHFVVVVDQNDRATIVFGNGINGQVPSGTIEIVYKIGGGAAGRVEAGTLTRLAKTYTDSLGNAVRLSATNAAASSGGDDREANASIAVNAPQSLRALSRSVAREDYEINAKRFVSGIARALHLTSNEYGVPENEGILFVVPAGGGVPSSIMLAAIAAVFEFGGDAPKTNTYDLHVQAAPYLVTAVTATVFFKAGVVKATGKAAIVAAIAAFFALDTTDANGETIPNPKIDFGVNMKNADGTPANEIAWSDVFDAIRDVTQVRKIDPDGLLLNGVRADLPIGSAQFPTLGVVTLIDGDTGQVL